VGSAESLFWDCLTKRWGDWSVLKSASLDVNMSVDDTGNVCVDGGPDRGAASAGAAGAGIWVGGISVPNTMLPTERHTINLLNNYAMCISLDSDLQIGVYARQNLNQTQPVNANVNATESAGNANAKIRVRINLLLLSLRFAYDACSISFDENDGDRLNITGKCHDIG
jgi:hypothetical protein